MADALKISIVTPSFNSGTTIERTLQSVLEQNYPNLEYIIIDGGSSDNTVDIIKKYEDQLHYWLSESDSGMYEALEKGFSQATGDILGWLNSDDMHISWTLARVNEVFTDLAQVDWMTTLFPQIRNPQGDIVETLTIPGYDKRAFYRGEYSSVSPFAIEQIQQESTFWRRSLWEKAGSQMDKSLKLAGDFELWARFYQHADLIGVRTPIGSIVNHPAQMTKLNFEQRLEEERRVLKNYGATVHTPISATIRRYVTGLPTRLKRIVAGSGYTYRTQIAFYDFANSRWMLKPRYF